MKKTYTFLVAVLLITTAFAQSPEKMSYQAVVRDSNDALVANQLVGIQISILQATTTGLAVYVETHTTTTNINGLLSLEIGTGSIVSGKFASIDWSDDIYFIKTETDPEGGNNYIITGVSQLMSVPYALYAKTSGSSTPGPEGQMGPPGAPGKDGVGISQTLSFDSPNLTLSEGGGIIDLTQLIDDADADSKNEIQNLTEVLTESNDGGAYQIKNIADPNSPQDVATKNYVDSKTPTYNLVEDAGNVLADGSATGFAFFPAQGKRFISHGVKMEPNFASGVLIRIELISAEGGFMVHVYNTSGSEVTLTLQGLEIPF